MDCIINVNPSKAAGKADADVVITAYNMDTPMVPKAFFNWNTSSRSKMWLTDVIADDPAVKPNPYSTLPYYIDPTTKTTGDMFSNRAAHEFGHVLGLFDAYGYGQHFPLGGAVLPAVPITVEVPPNDVMRSEWNVHYKYTDSAYEMLLYAWSTSSLQLYTDSILGSQSQAFYH